MTTPMTQPAAAAMRTDAEGPYCVITGSASGIGRTLACRLLDAGWLVSGIDRNSADQHAPELAAHENYRHETADLCDEHDIAHVCAWLRDSRHGQPVTAFVHSAGIVRTGGLHDTCPDDADQMWRLHVGAPLRLLDAMGDSLLAGRGRIVLLSSRAILGRANRAAYAATKAAQVGLVRSLAAELIGRGVTVNAVAPGAVDTPMLRDPLRGGAPRIDLPMGRLITATEVAAAIAFLIGPEAGAITGQTLYLCGGASLGQAPL